MEDFASMITQFLSSEDGMNQLRSVSAALGLPDPSAALGQTSANQFVPPAQPVGGTQQNSGGGGIPFFSSEASSQASAPSLDFNTLMLMQRALSAFSQEDHNTELLRALKPHFSAERAKKVDDAIRILQLIRLLPLVKDLGLLDRLKGGG